MTTGSTRSLLLSLGMVPLLLIMTGCLILDVVSLYKHKRYGTPLPDGWRPSFWGNLGTTLLFVCMAIGNTETVLWKALYATGINAVLFGLLLRGLVWWKRWRVGARHTKPSENIRDRVPNR